MHQRYLGDSYDIVKRFWAESRRSIAHLYAHSKFVPSRMRAEYTLSTTIRVLDTRPRIRLDRNLALTPIRGFLSPLNPRNG